MKRERLKALTRHHCASVSKTEKESSSSSFWVRAARGLCVPLIIAHFKLPAVDIYIRICIHNTYIYTHIYTYIWVRAARGLCVPFDHRALQIACRIYIRMYTYHYAYIYIYIYAYIYIYMRSRGPRPVRAFWSSRTSNCLTCIDTHIYSYIYIHTHTHTHTRTHAHTHTHKYMIFIGLMH
jgi:hypothetical protein